ncbi:MAG: RHS repeat-associated core domain-containing protein [Anaerolineae bacterium]
MFSRGLRRRICQLISVILCVTILVQSSPLPAWPYLRSRSDSRRPLAGVRPVRAAEKTTAGIAPRVLPTPSPAVPVSPQATPPPRSNQGRPVAVEAVSHLSALPQSLPHSASDFGPSGWAQRRSRIADSGDRNSRSPISNLHSPISNIPLTTGWNLISLPLEPPDTDPAAVLNSIAGSYNLVYAYDGCDDADPWKLYDPAAPGPANDLTAIDHRIGLWIEMTADATLDVAGAQPTSTDIPLCAGWNLIGYPLAEAQPVAEALASIEGKYDLVFAYDPTDAADPWEVFEVGVPAWSNDLQVMQAGRGFWVHATEDVTLTIAKPEPAATPTSTPTATPTLPPAEGNPPTAEITSPADGSEMTDFVDIVGTADDPDGDLVEYRLQYRPVGTSGTVSAAQRRLRAVALQQADAEWTTIAAGNTPVVNDVLGTLDPTLLLNGMFEIRLLAVDSEGQQTTASLHLVISGNQKIGHFTLSFTDLAIPVAGLDITVIRSYDSRDKRVGDFGVGWTMQLTSVELAESGAAGEDWEQTATGGIIPTYCIQPTQLHMVTVRFPNDEVHRFAPRVTPRCQGLIPIQFARVDYVALPGTTSSLQPMAGSDVVILGSPGGPVELRDLDLNLYDPRSYTLTTRDGTSFVVDEFAGVQRITDPNGNSLTITPNDITHSTGRSVAFQRDGLGRIIRITDPIGHSLTYSYDANGDLVSVTDRQDNVTTFTYDGDHRLLEIHDPLGRRPARNEYGADGRLIAIVDADGQRVEFDHDLNARVEVVTDRLGNPSVLSYDDEGNIISVTDALNNTTHHTYDDDGNRLSTTDPLGNTISWTYNGQGDKLSETDPLGNTRTWTYNSRGQVLSATDAMGNTTTFNYDQSGNLTSRTDPEGNTTTNTYDAKGLLTSTTDPLGNTTNFEYDAYGRLIQSTDPLGNKENNAFDANGKLLSRAWTRTTNGSVVTEMYTYEYDTSGNLIRARDPVGYTVEKTLDAIGRMVAGKDKAGRVTEFTYNYMDKPVQVAFPGGDTQSSVYNANGDMTGFADQADRSVGLAYDPVGRSTAISQTGLPDDLATVYDAAGHVTQTVDPWGRAFSHTYDAAGNVIAETDQAGHVMHYTYDADGNLLSTTDALGRTTTFSYTANNLRYLTTYPDGTTVRTTYDGLGRVIAEMDQAGRVTQYEYDVAGRLTSVTDALGQTTSYTYDERGNLLTITDAANNMTAFEYDALGRMTRRELPDGSFETMTYSPMGIETHTDFNGNTTTYSYNVKGQLVEKRYADGSTVSFTYTDAMQRASVTDSRGTTQYLFDDRDRLLQVTQPNGQTITYTYDIFGNVLTMQTPAGTTRYTYDILDRLETVTDPDGGVTTYTYDAVSNLTGVADPNGTVTTYTYDDLNRLTSVTNKKSDGTVISSYTYTLGPAGERTRVVEDNGRTVDCVYDALYRLVEERINDPTSGAMVITYTYDSVGNRLTKSVDGATTNYTYDSRGRLLTEGASHYTYDASGNLLSRTEGTDTTHYEYDFENRLVQVTASDGSITRFVYDVDGRMVSKSKGSGTTNYLWDERPERHLPVIVLETDGGGATLASYVYGNALISMERGGVRSYYHYDGQMSTRQLTDDGETVTDSYTYDAFGNLLARTGTTVNPFLYTGQQYDPNTGFYYLRARHYDPQAGRFISMDPVRGSIFDPPSLHCYLYAGDDPVNRADPTGLFSLTEMAVVTGIIGVLATMILVAGVSVGIATGLPTESKYYDPAKVGATTIGFSFNYRPFLWSPNPAWSTWRCLGITGGLEALAVRGYKPQLHLFVYFGMSATISWSSEMMEWSSYVGPVWNVSEPDDYSGSFLAVSAGVPWGVPTLTGGEGGFGYILPPNSTFFASPGYYGDYGSYGFSFPIKHPVLAWLDWKASATWAVNYYVNTGPLFEASPLDARWWMQVLNNGAGKFWGEFMGSLGLS